MQKLLNKANNKKNQKGQSSFEILFVTIIIILLAGTLYYFTFGSTKDISDIGIIKTEVETYFVQNNILLTIQDIDLEVQDAVLSISLKLSAEKDFTESQIQEMQDRIKEKIGKDVALFFN